jgi:hypothetical protein
MANLLTATVENQFAHVLLRTEFSATGSLTATIERSADGGATWTTVRGTPITLVGPDPVAGNRIGYLYDTEMPLDVAINYRSTDNLGTVTTAGPVTVVSSGLAWLKDPARPWANVRIDDCSDTPVPTQCDTPLSEPAVSLVGDGLGTEEYAGDFTLFPILNRPRPADVYAFRKDATTSWRVVSKTLTSMNTLNTFYAWGGPILLQLPPIYGWPDRYYQPAEVVVSRLSNDLRVPYRMWDVPLTVVDAPVGAAQGTCENNWCIIGDTYPTWGDLTATGLTWGDVVEGEAATC